MSGIVSYSQNFEDVMLWRALKDIKNGFYIDVGANHPIIDSVTKAFYEHGWHGINLEPELELFNFLEEDRPNDINLNVAVSATIDSIDFYVSNVRGWSTTDKDQVKNLEEKDSFQEIRTVNALSLDKIIETHHVTEIHFLKVDVEGAEKDVLESFSFTHIRPWITVVEATKPTTQIDVSSNWEYILLDNDYIFAYFDGLNKFYVAKEHSELLSSFNSPPNVFDEFALISTVEANSKAHEWWIKTSEAEAKASEAEAKASEAEAKASEAETKASEAEAKASEAEAKASEAEAKASEAEAKASEAEAKASEAVHNYYVIMNSNSWKITKPLRLAVKWLKWFVIGVKHWITFSPTSRPRRVAKDILLSIKHSINEHPNLKIKIINILNRFPGLENRIKKILTPETNMPQQKNKEMSKYFKEIKTEVETYKKRMNNE